VTCGKDTTYEGTVGDMNASYSANNFDWGLMVHELERTDFKGLKYQVVNYWVQ
jgi:hypothetical protein